jgi:hypothetical protein
MDHLGKRKKNTESIKQRQSGKEIERKDAIDRREKEPHSEIKKSCHLFFHSDHFNVGHLNRTTIISLFNVCNFNLRGLIRMQI